MKLTFDLTFLNVAVTKFLFFVFKSRKLDVYFEYEEKLMSKSTLDKSLLDIISDPDGRNTHTHIHTQWLSKTLWELLEIPPCSRTHGRFKEK